MLTTDIQTAEAAKADALRELTWFKAELTRLRRETARARRVLEKARGKWLELDKVRQKHTRLGLSDAPATGQPPPPLMLEIDSRLRRAEAEKVKAERELSTLRFQCTYAANRVKSAERVLSIERRGADS